MRFNTAATSITQLVLSNDFLEVWKDDSSGQHSAFARIAFRSGDVLCDFGASAIVQHPSYLTVQLSADEHIYLQPAYLQYINHSCEPNVFFDTTEFKLVALRDINAGDELYYFYPSTEWDMAQPFRCLCNSGDCLGYINGASYLSKEQVNRYRFSSYISRLLSTKQ